MTRTVIGFVLLFALLLSGFAVQYEMEAVHRPIARMLEVSADSSMESDWDTAASLSRSAAYRWKKAWNFSAAFADHEPMEEIDCLFAQLAIYTDQQETLEFAAACQELARRVDAMADAHVLNWQNLL